MFALSSLFYSNVTQAQTPADTPISTCFDKVRANYPSGCIRGATSSSPSINYNSPNGSQAIELGVWEPIAIEALTTLCNNVEPISYEWTVSNSNWTFQTISDVTAKNTHIKTDQSGDCTVTCTAKRKGATHSIAINYTRHNPENPKIVNTNLIKSTLCLNSPPSTTTITASAQGLPSVTNIFVWTATGSVRIVSPTNPNVLLSTIETILPLNSITIKGISNGQGEVVVQAKNAASGRVSTGITTGTNSNKVSMWVGAPTTPTVTPMSSPYAPYYLPALNSINVYSSAGATTGMDWQFANVSTPCTTTNPWACTSNSVQIVPPTTGSMFAEIRALTNVNSTKQIWVRPYNGCGSGGYGTFWVRTGSPNWFKAYPNPANEVISVDFFTEENKISEQGISVVLLDSDGTVVFVQEKIFETPLLINTAKYPPGAYILQVSNGEESEKQQIIIKH